jgi:hypothetical protein
MAYKDIENLTRDDLRWRLMRLYVSLFQEHMLTGKGNI